MRAGVATVRCSGATRGGLVRYRLFAPREVRFRVAVLLALPFAASLPVVAAFAGPIVARAFAGVLVLSHRVAVSVCFRRAGSNVGIGAFGFRRRAGVAALLESSTQSLTSCFHLTFRRLHSPVSRS